MNDKIIVIGKKEELTEVLSRLRSTGKEIIICESIEEAKQHISQKINPMIMLPFTPLELIKREIENKAEQKITEFVRPVQITPWFQPVRVTLTRSTKFLNRSQRREQDKRNKK